MEGGCGGFPHRVNEGAKAAEVEREAADRDVMVVGPKDSTEGLVDAELL